MRQEIGYVVLFLAVVVFAGACSRGDTETYEWLTTRAEFLQKNALELSDGDRMLAVLEDEFGATEEEQASWNRIKRAAYKIAYEKTGTKRESFQAWVNEHNELVREYNAKAAALDWEPFKNRDDLPSRQLQEYIGPADQ